MLRRLWDHFWEFKLTPAGRMGIFVVIFAAVGSISTEIPIYQLFFGLVSLAIVSDVVSFWFRPRLEISGYQTTALPILAAGVPCTIQFRLKNVGRRTAFDCMLGLFPRPQGLRHLDADRCVEAISLGEEAWLTVTLLAARRGRFLLPAFLAYSSFPFNLSRYQGAKTEPQWITVVPAWQPLEELHLLAAAHFAPSEGRLSNGAGLSPEFLGNREYVPGDSIQRLDFRAWARTTRPIVREFQQEHSHRAAVVLDTYCPARQSSDVLEAAISLTAAIAEHLTSSGSQLEILVAGSDLYFLQSPGGRARFQVALELLTDVRPAHSDSVADVATSLPTRLDGVRLAICIFLDWDASRADLVNRLDEAGCSVRILVVRPPNRPTTAPFPRLATAIAPDDIRAGNVRQI